MILQAAKGLEVEDAGGASRDGGAVAAVEEPLEVDGQRGSDRAIKTILVADDESHILHVVSLKLKNAGYRVLTARDGQEALDYARENSVDLVISDVNMPRMDGIDATTRQLRLIDLVVVEASEATMHSHWPEPSVLPREAASRSRPQRADRATDDSG